MNKFSNSIDHISILMIGGAIPDDLMSELSAIDTSPGMQGFNHIWSTINGIENAVGMGIDLLTFPLISDYPRHPYKYVKGRTWKHKSSTQDILIPTINIFPLKLIFRFLIVTYHLLRWNSLRKKAKNLPIIITYSSQFSQLLAIRICRIFYKFKAFAVLTDPLSMNIPNENIIRKNLRKIDRILQKRFLSSIDGLIVLTESIGLDFAPTVPSVIVEGIAPTVNMSEEIGSDISNKTIIAYAGTLKNEYDIRGLLHSLEYLNSDVELWIFGSGELADEVKEFSKLETRVKYFGFVHPEKLREISKDVSAFISPLPTDGWFTKYKFPSKILEYMANGKPVISTRYPTIPKEYESLIIWIQDETPAGISSAIKEFQMMTNEEKKALGVVSREFVQKFKSEDAQGKKMWEFILSIVNNSIKNG